MILSAIVTFTALGLRWSIDLQVLQELQGLDLDKPPPSFQSCILSVSDGRLQPVHPIYFRQFLDAPATRALVFGAAATALYRGCRRIIDPPSGEVCADGALENSPGEALAKYLSVNATHGL